MTVVTYRVRKKVGAKSNFNQDFNLGLLFSFIKEKRSLRQFPFVPCVEPKGGRGERFLTEHPRILLQRGQVAPVPIIMGVNDSEGMIKLTGKS